MHHSSAVREDGFFDLESSFAATLSDLGSCAEVDLIRIGTTRSAWWPRRPRSARYSPSASSTCGPVGP